MKVILYSDVAKLGKTGDLVTVAAGFARNYLIPNKLAAEATPKNVSRLDHQKRLLLHKQSREKKDSERLAERLDNYSCTITCSVGEGDKLYGAVTNIDIEKALQKDGLKIDRKAILLEEPIKNLGVFTVPVKVHPEVTANVKVWVVKE